MTGSHSCSSVHQAWHRGGRSRQVDRMQQPTPRGRSLPLLARRGHLFGAAMMQNLDIVDVYLLVGTIVYFGLLVLRRI
jgi:hypothetical protein